MWKIITLNPLFSCLFSILLVVHTQYRPFVRVNKRHNTLHNADFFALATSFVTLTAGIYLFQTVGTNTGFQIFLQFVVVGANVLFLVMSIFWYLTLRLFDMGNALSDSDENKEFKARFVLCLQKLLPDWREESIKEEMDEAEKFEHRAMGRADLIKMLAAKKVARKWITKTKLNKLAKEATAVEELYERDQVKLAKRMHSLKVKAKSRLEARKLGRRTSVSGKSTSESVSKTDEGNKEEKETEQSTTKIEKATLLSVGDSKSASTEPERAVTKRSPPPPPPPRKTPRKSPRKSPRKLPGTTNKSSVSSPSSSDGVGDAMSVASLGTPNFKTARSNGNLAGTPQFEATSGKKKMEHKGSNGSSKKSSGSSSSKDEPKIKYFKVVRGLKLSKLGFRLRAPTAKTGGYCWVSNVDLSGPSALSGVRENDRLVLVGSKTTKGMGEKDIVGLLKQTKKPFELGFQAKARRNTAAWQEQHFHVSELLAKKNSKLKKKEQEDKEFS